MGWEEIECAEFSVDISLKYCSPLPLYVSSLFVVLSIVLSTSLKGLTIQQSSSPPKSEEPDTVAGLEEYATYSFA